MKKLLSCLFLLIASFALVACQLGTTVTVESLEVAGYKEVYEKNEKFSTDGIEVTAKLSNGTSLVVTDKATITAPENFGTVGSYEVKVEYDGVTATFTVTIKEADLLSVLINTEAVKTSYMIGETFSSEGLVVEGHYSDKTTVEFTEYVVVLKDSKGAVVEGAFTQGGVYTATVSAQGFEQSFEVKASTVADVVAAAVASGIENASAVVSGTLAQVTTYSEYVYSYSYGENYFTYSDTYGNNYHYELDSEGYAFGAVESMGYDYETGQDVLTVNPAEEEADIINGYKVNALYYSANFYGASGLVAGIYEAALTNEATYEIVDGVYSIVFPYSVESWGSYYYFTIALSFELGEAGEFSKVTYSETMYYSDEVVVAEDGSWTVSEGVEKEASLFIYEQVAGERTLVNPYTQSALGYTSFDFVTAEGEVYEETTYEIVSGEGDKATLSIGNAYPETAIAAFNNFECVITDAEGNLVDQYSGGLYVYYSSYNGTLVVYGKQAGTYTLTVTCGEIVKEYTYVVTAAAPTYISSLVYAENNWGYKEFSENSFVNTFVDTTIYFKAGFPEYTLNGYTVQLAEENAAVTIAEITDEFSEPYEACYSFTATELGSYVVVLKSTAVEDLTTELVITVNELPDVKSILVGKYEYSSYYGDSYSVEFAPAEEGISGLVTISSESYYGAQSGVYSYVFENGALVTELVDGDYLNVKLVLTSDFNLAISQWGNNYPLTKWSVYSEITNVQYFATLFGMETYISFFGDGSGMFYNGRVSTYFSSSAEKNEDGSYTITLVEEGIFVNNQVILSADYKSVAASVDTGEVVELLFELPLTSLAYGVWSNGNNATLYMNEYGCYGTIGTSYPDFEIKVAKNEDGTYTITFNFEIYGGTSFIEGNTAILSAECDKITFTGTDGVVYELIQ